MIEKLAVIALQIAITGNKPGHPVCIFDRKLYEFPILQEGIHTGVVFGRLGGGCTWGCTLRARQSTEQQDHGNQSTHSVHVSIKAWGCHPDPRKGSAPSWPRGAKLRSSSPRSRNESSSASFARPPSRGRLGLPALFR